jgi:hypothetical protein
MSTLDIWFKFPCTRCEAKWKRFIVLRGPLREALEAIWCPGRGMCPETRNGRLWPSNAVS